MKIIFTGHRNKRASVVLLANLRNEFPGAVWYHGNAKSGFDKQVDEYVVRHRIPCVRFEPLYAEHPTPRDALLARNIEMAETMEPGDLCVALYDGRVGGGTWHTRQAVLRRGFKVRDWKPN